MKKVFLFLAIAALFLSGCSHNKISQVTQVQVMDQPGQDGKYHYENFDLKFTVTLPPEFIYYQTQRKSQEDFDDIEFFVPTSDTAYPQEVQSYGKVMVVRVYDKQAWDDMVDNAIKMTYDEIGNKGGRVYTVRFWQEAPADWQNKWSDSMKQDILNTFQVK